MKKKKDVSKKDQIKTAVKFASSLVVGYGVGEIVGYILKDFQPTAKGIKKTAIKIGALAITGMAMKKVCDYVEEEIDEVFDICEEISIELSKEKEKEEKDETTELVAGD